LKAAQKQKKGTQRKKQGRHGDQIDCQKFRPSVRTDARRCKATAAYQYLWALTMASMASLLFPWRPLFLLFTSFLLFVRLSLIGAKGCS
jgi:hypothetical protein